MNDTDDRGCGFTTRRIITELRKRTVESARAELTSLLGSRGLKKKQIDDMTAGFEDGFNAAVRHLIGMGVIVVREDG